MNNLNTTSNKKQVITVKEIQQNNLNAKIIMLDPIKDYEKIKSLIDNGKLHLFDLTQQTISTRAINFEKG